MVFFPFTINELVLRHPVFASDFNLSPWWVSLFVLFTSFVFKSKMLFYS